MGHKSELFARVRAHRVSSILCIITGLDRVLHELINICQEHASEGRDLINAQGGEYGNALQAASYGGHDKVVQMLMDAGADVSAQGGHYGNALQAALYQGHDKVVQMLMDAGADVNAQGGLCFVGSKKLVSTTGVGSAV